MEDNSNHHPSTLNVVVEDVNVVDESQNTSKSLEALEESWKDFELHRLPIKLVFDVMYVSPERKLLNRNHLLFMFLFCSSSISYHIMVFQDT